jgi:hypothetical protein
MHDLFNVLDVVSEVRVEQGWRFFDVLSSVGQQKFLSGI